MKIIKAEKTDSTNNALKEMSAKKKIENFTYFITENQNKGRGQRGKYWYSTKDSLLFSFIFYPENFLIENQFYISKCVSLSIINVLKKYSSDIKIKWPNDIYFNKRKIGGILIENTISNRFIDSCIVGVGLNINQDNFPENLPNPASLFQVTGKKTDKENLLNEIAIQTTENLSELNNNSFSDIDKKYLEDLYLFKTENLFKDETGIFKGIIKNVNPEGYLVVKKDNNSEKKYSIQEIEFL